MTVTDTDNTLAWLTDRYGPHLGTKELAEAMRYKDEHSVLEAVRRGSFPVKTFRLGRYRVADVRDVAKYLDQQRAA